MLGDDAHVDDLAGPGDGFGAGAGVSGVVLVGLEGLHVEGEGVLHALHGWVCHVGWLVGWLRGKKGFFWNSERGCGCMCVCVCVCDVEGVSVCVDVGWVLVKEERTGEDGQRGHACFCPRGETKMNRSTIPLAGESAKYRQRIDRHYRHSKNKGIALYSRGMKEFVHGDGHIVVNTMEEGHCTCGLCYIVGKWSNET